MLALQIAAIVFLVLSAACLFGPQLVVYGPRAIPTLVRQPQARFVGGLLTSAAALALTAPYFGSAVSAGGQNMTLVMLDVFTMNFGLV